MPKLKPNDVPLTPEENARIKAAISDDPDTFELDAEWFASARPAIEVAPHIVERYLRYRAEQAGNKHSTGNGPAGEDNLGDSRSPDQKR